MQAPRCDDPSNLLIPWYLNGTLEAAEEAQVRSHLASCPTCSRELAELSEITDPLAARASEQGRTEISTPARPRRLRWAAAAVAIVGVLLLAYWMRARNARQELMEGEEHVVLLDLHSGSQRGGGSLPTLGLAGDVGLVDLRLGAPVNPAATYEMELRSPEGKTLARSPKAPLKLDPLGRAVFRVKGAMLSSPGQFQLVLREFDAGGSVREYPYPFRVVRP